MHSLLKALLNVLLLIPLGAVTNLYLGKWFLFFEQEAQPQRYTKATPLVQQNPQPKQLRVHTTDSPTSNDSSTVQVEGTKSQQSSMDPDPPTPHQHPTSGLTATPSVSPTAAPTVGPTSSPTEEPSAGITSPQSQPKNVNVTRTHGTNEETWIMLVQGPQAGFLAWKQRMTTSSALLVYASFDTPINDPGCTSNSDLTNCRAIYIPNTTWTEGRNELAKYALCEEKWRQKEFLYWNFADDDLDLDCRLPTISNTTDCWMKYFNFLENELPQTNCPVLALALHTVQGPGWNLTGGFNTVHTYDAISNAFHRRHVRKLLPYAVLPTGSSQLLSQAIHFAVMRECYPSSAVVPHSFAYINEKHRDYIRGGLTTEYANPVIQDSYHAYYPLPVFGHNGEIGAQLVGLKGPFPSLEEVFIQVKNVSESLQNKCAPIERRFDDWEQSFGACHT
jgi:hypothetical protein